jgi:hypothetical protein
MSQASGFLESCFPDDSLNNVWSLLMTESRVFLSLLLEPQLLLRSLKLAIVVGTVLVAINYGDLILRGDTEKIEWYKIALTYIVPYCVSTYSAIMNSVGKK